MNLKRNTYLLIGGTVLAIGLAGCVSNKAVQTTQVGDYDMTCEQLKYELTELGARFEESKDESGVTGKNVGLAIAFWPGIIVNEVRSNKNQDSIDARIQHLSGLYKMKCVGTTAAAESNSPSQP